MKHIRNLTVILSAFLLAGTAGAREIQSLDGMWNIVVDAENEGRAILSQLRLIDFLDKDPVADKILFNLIEFAAQAAPQIYERNLK